jgi:hypothetical protein
MKSKRPIRREVTAELIHEIVYSDNGPARRKFAQKHGDEVDSFIKTATECHLAIETRAKQWPKTERSEWVRLFLHVAANNLTSAVHLLVSGYPVPAGNLLRQFAEAVAMAMLICDSQSQVLELFLKDQEKYPVDGAINKILQKKQQKRLIELLGLDTDAWQQFKKMTGFYGFHSHASVLSVLFSIKVEWPNVPIIGGGV